MATPASTSKLGKFRALSSADRWLLARATGWLLVARILLAVVPFRRLAAWLSADAGVSGEAADPELLARIGRAVGVASYQVPWRADCFPQTIAARMLLKRAGHASTIHLGVDRTGEKGLQGHAWL
ncbi:MAG: lasso peptide biosynthesis B2 protein, partial [Gammaproteobacteria bacterium]|nr:lasso peptide biosynthesis B2 protein [Gammaproteobacteria bacterium]